MLDHIHQAQTLKDLAVAKRLAMEFANVSPYLKYISEDTVEDILKGAMLNENSVVLLCGDKGMIVLSIIPFIYGSARMAVELAWWVDPEYRSKHLGRALLDAAEAWAKGHDAEGIVMISLDDEIGKVYEKRGYTLKERTYFKEL